MSVHTHVQFHASLKDQYKNIFNKKSRLNEFVDNRKWLERQLYFPWLAYREENDISLNEWRKFLMWVRAAWLNRKISSHFATVDDCGFHKRQIEYIKDPECGWDEKTQTNKTKVAESQNHLFEDPSKHLNPPFAGFRGPFNDLLHVPFGLKISEVPPYHDLTLSPEGPFATPLDHYYNTPERFTETRISYNILRKFIESARYENSNKLMLCMMLCLQRKEIVLDSTLGPTIKSFIDEFPEDHSVTIPYSPVMVKVLAAYLQKHAIPDDAHAYAQIMFGDNTGEKVYFERKDPHYYAQNSGPLRMTKQSIQYVLRDRERSFEYIMERPYGYVSPTPKFNKWCMEENILGFVNDDVLYQQYGPTLLHSYRTYDNTHPHRSDTHKTSHKTVNDSDTVGFQGSEYDRIRGSLLSLHCVDWLNPVSPHNLEVAIMYALKSINEIPLLEDEILAAEKADLISHEDSVRMIGAVTSHEKQVSKRPRLRGGLMNMRSMVSALAHGREWHTMQSAMAEARRWGVVVEFPI